MDVDDIPLRKVLGWMTGVGLCVTLLLAALLWYSFD